MSDTNSNEVVLLTIKVSNEDVEKKVLAAREALVLLRKERKALDTDYAQGSITAKEYAKSQQAIETQMASANKQVKEGNKILREYAQSQKTAEDSLKRMHEGLKTQTSDLLGYAQSTKAIKDRVKELNAEFAAEDAMFKASVSSIDALESAIEELQAAYRGLSKAQSEDPTVGGAILSKISELTKQYEKQEKVMSNSQKGVKDYIRDMDILGVSVGGTIDAFKTGTQGAATFAKAIFTSRGALIALTAIPIVALLSGLYVILTKSQKGMDFLAQATSAVSAIFSAFSSKIISIGESIVGVFDNPKKAVIEFGNFIEQNLINRFKAFGVILEGIRSGDFTKITNGVLQLGTGAENAYSRLKKVAQAGVDIAKATQAIEEAEISLNVQRGRSEKFIERQKQIAEDTTKSTQVRAAAARAAFAEGVKLQAAEEALQLKRVKLAQAEAKASQNTRAEQKKVSEEQAKLDEIAKNRIGERTELQNQLNSIEAEGAAKAKENREKLAAASVAEAEAALVIARRKGEDTIELERELLVRQISLINAKAAAEKAAAEKGTGYNAKIKLIEQNAITERLEAAKVAAAKIAEITYKARLTEIESTLALTQRGSEQELKLTIQTLNANRVKQLEEAKRTIKDRTALLNEEARINLVAGRAISDARLAFAKETINKEAALSEARIQTEFDLGGQSLAAQRKAADSRIDLEEKTQKRLLDIQLEYGEISDDDYLVRLNAVQAKALAAKKAANKQLADEDRANRIAMLDADLMGIREGSKLQLNLKLQKLKEEREAAIASAKEEKAAIDAINKKFDKEEVQARKDYTKSLQNQIVDIANQTIATLSTIVDAQVASQTGALEKQQAAMLSSAALSAEGRAQIEADFQKKKEEIEFKANEKRKKIALAQNLINGALAVTKAFAELGPIGGAIATALIAAQVLAQQSIIDNQKAFATGGVYQSDSKGAYVMGPGSGTSDSINARISNGEAIINAKSTAKYYPLLSAINQAEGGKAFPGIAGAKAPVFGTENILPKFNGGGVNIGFDENKIAAAVRDGIKDMRPQVAVVDINKGQRRRERVVVANDH